MIPNRDACLALLNEAGASRDVVDHVQSVAALAEAMAKRAPNADPDVVRAGALLHDVGRAFTHGPDHVPRGVSFLEQHGVDDRVIACVAGHMGAGIEPEQARAWGWLPDRSYVPEDLEAKIVAHADNLTMGTRYGSLADVEEKLRSAGLEDVIERVRALHANVRDAIGVDPDAVAAGMDAGSR